MQPAAQPGHVVLFLPELLLPSIYGPASEQYWHTIFDGDAREQDSTVRKKKEAASKSESWKVELHQWLRIRRKWNQQRQVVRWITSAHKINDVRFNRWASLSGLSRVETMANSIDPFIKKKLSCTYRTNRPPGEGGEGGGTSCHTNFGRIVLGCIKTDFCKWILDIHVATFFNTLVYSTRVARFTPLQNQIVC